MEQKEPIRDIIKGNGYTIQVSDSLSVIPDDMCPKEREDKIRELHSISNLWIAKTAFFSLSGFVLGQFSDIPTVAHVSPFVFGVLAVVSAYKAVDYRLDEKILTKIFR